jgi:hypothetical protein
MNIADILNDPNKRGAIFFNTALLIDANSKFIVPVDSSWYYLAPGEYPQFGLKCDISKSVLVLPFTEVSWYRLPLYGEFNGTLVSGASLYLGQIKAPCPKSIQITISTIRK